MFSENLKLRKHEEQRIKCMSRDEEPWKQEETTSTVTQDLGDNATDPRARQAP